MGKAFDCSHFSSFLPSPSLTLPLAAWCPIGPCLVSPAALGKGADALALTTHINGQLAQKASTADLVIKVVRLHSFPSSLRNSQY
jgi:2-keto-4-pentenoate hydratase/2-oxohepta-3-ene-1,7-dioic acid hydratase in catechol pathway